MTLNVTPEHWKWCYSIDDKLFPISDL